MTIQALTTKLTAVNSMLRVIGEAPITDLVTDATLDTTMAEGLLDEQAREVQSRGWYFNVYQKEFSPSAGTITIPEQFILADSEDRNAHYVQRGTTLFNLTDGTSDQFTDDITLDIVEILDWDDIPEVCRRYIIAKSSSLFYEQATGAASAPQRLLTAEAEALWNLKAANMRVGNYNVLDSDTAIKLVQRGSVLDRF